ncbi:MAG: hypothetical protein KDD11_04045 [Acidobacteria bacterium]|nr:hypothetical protein [Acidobacteriota bacterium]
MQNQRFAERIGGLSDTKLRLLAQCLEENQLDASWLFEELPVPPRNPTEALLVEIWEEVLDVADVGIEDNFFDLGGDSILSVRIVAKARERGLEITSRQLFERPSVARLAEVAKAVPAPEPAAPARSSHRGALTPESFPEAELDAEELAKVIALLSARGARREPEAPAAAGGAPRLDAGGEIPRLMALRAAQV